MKKQNPFTEMNLFQKLVLKLFTKCFGLTVEDIFFDDCLYKDMCDDLYEEAHNNEKALRKQIEKLHRVISTKDKSIDKWKDRYSILEKKLNNSTKLNTKIKKDKNKLLEYKYKCKLLAQYNDILQELYDKAAFIACMPEAIRNDLLPQYHRPTVEEPNKNN